MECFWGSWAKAGLANSNKKTGGLVAPKGSYLRYTEGEGARSRIDCLSPGVFRSPIRNYELVTLRAVILGHALSGGPSINSRPPAVLLVTQNEC